MQIAEATQVIVPITLPLKRLTKQYQYCKF